jgi:hypothetical protein
MSTSPDPILCKPTRWFLLRALVMLGMFGGFTVWFYYDAQIGYRAKNEAFFTEQAFKSAVEDFTNMNADGALTPEAWKTHAAAQKIEFPDDPWVLPQGMKQPVPWPDILHDFEKVGTLNARPLWVEYTGALGISDKVPDEPYSARKIHEQWVVLWICFALFLVTLFFLIRTMRRSIRADDEAITDATGRRVAYEDLTLLDLRKWDTKGIAFAEFRAPSGSGRMRLDGLTYGGFRQEDDQPAERMMQRLRANFTGEILEYAAAEDTGTESPAESDGDSEETPERAP